MTVDTFWIIAFGLIVAWCHSGNLLKDLLVIAAELVVMIVIASRPVAGRWPLEKEHIAQFELLHPLDILTWYGIIHLVHALTKSITVDAWSGLDGRRRLRFCVGTVTAAFVC